MTIVDVEFAWTPKMVGDRLVAAGRWIQAHGRPVGPRQPMSVHFNFIASALDPREFDKEFNGPPEVADPDEIRRTHYKVSPRRVTAFEAALTWPSVYLAGPENEGSGRVLKIWLRCKVFRTPFDASCKSRGWSRATAYRLQDRALGTIAAGLVRDRVRLED